MKSIAVILVVILLGLFVLPCSDGNDRCGLLADADSSPVEHNHDQDTADMCSPFCSCSCCGIALNSFHFSTLTFYTPILPIPVAKKIVFRNVTFTTYYLGSIWQPPQSIV